MNLISLGRAEHSENNSVKGTLCFPGLVDISGTGSDKIDCKFVDGRELGDFMLWK